MSMNNDIIWLSI